MGSRRETRSLLQAARLLGLFGCFGLAQLGHGVGGVVFALRVCRPALALGGVVILSHWFPCRSAGLGADPDLRLSDPVTGERLSIVTGDAIPRSVFRGVIPAPSVFAMAASFPQLVDWENIM